MSLNFIIRVLYNIAGVALSYHIYNLMSAAYKSKRCPISVNYHFTRECNKSCGFCFHTALNSHQEPIQNAKKGLAKLKKAGMRKLNFAGGEPFLKPKFLGELVTYCKEVLKLESVSIVSNGSLINKAWFIKYGHNLDILAVSCDSFNEQTNIDIGRGAGNQVTKLYQIAEWCQEYNVKYKLNTVVCKLNMHENMNSHIESLQPFRWKCFQVLMVAGENDSATTLRDVRKFMITREEYQEFCKRHEHQKAFVPELNHLMAKSYLILDEHMRFLDRDGREPSKSILEVDIETALSQVFWDRGAFMQRGGIYDWQREDAKAAKDGLEW